MRASLSTAQDLGMPAIYLHLLAELLNTLGVDEQSLLLRVGLDPARLKSTELRVSQTQASEFVTRALIESGEPGLGIMLARELKLPIHGALGTAVMSSRTLGYADTANFTRAFKRWTDTSPSQFRNASTASGPVPAPTDRGLAAG